MSYSTQKAGCRGQFIHALAVLGLGLALVMSFFGAGVLAWLLPLLRPDAPVSRFFARGMDWGGELFLSGFATACFLYFCWGLIYVLKRAQKEKPPQDPDAQ
jgi:hypothetical protein